MRRPKLRKVSIRTVVYVLLGIWIVIALFPPFWMLMTSFKTKDHVYDMPPQWFTLPKFEIYRDAFTFTPLARYIRNSMIVALSVTAVCVFVGAPAAWGLSQFKLPGNRIWFFLVIGSRMIPPIALLTPFFSLFVRLHIIDNILALVIPYVFFNLPLAIWIMKNYFDGMPRELFEAGRVDACNQLQLFLRIGLPVNVPGIVLAAILAFLFSWNEFMFALVLTQEHAVTLPVGITNFFADGFVLWNTLSAATVVSLIPAILFVAVFQRYIIRGVTEGALKG
jgi:multiple sugar transport system permease protein